MLIHEHILDCVDCLTYPIEFFLIDSPKEVKIFLSPQVSCKSHLCKMFQPHKVSGLSGRHHDLHLELLVLVRNLDNLEGFSI